MDRAPLSKSLRFRIFKRDQFVCQYCGRRPPEVILHCDHIHPVAEGGSDDEANLITSCRDCNLGKGKTLLGQDLPTPDMGLANLERMQELAELMAYKEADAAVREAREEVADLLHNLWCDVWHQSSSPQRAIAQWVKIYGPSAVHDAIEKCEGKQVEDRRRYVGAILRNTRNCSQGKTCDSCGNARASAESDAHYCCLLHYIKDTSDGPAYAYHRAGYTCGEWDEDGNRDALAAHEKRMNRSQPGQLVR